MVALADPDHGPALLAAQLAAQLAATEHAAWANRIFTLSATPRAGLRDGRFASPTTSRNSRQIIRPWSGGPAPAGPVGPAHRQPRRPRRRRPRHRRPGTHQVAGRPRGESRSCPLRIPTSWNRRRDERVQLQRVSPLRLTILLATVRLLVNSMRQIVGATIGSLLLLNGCGRTTSSDSSGEALGEPTCSAQSRTGGSYARANFKLVDRTATQVRGELTLQLLPTVSPAVHAPPVAISRGIPEIRVLGAADGAPVAESNNQGGAEPASRVDLGFDNHGTAHLYVDSSISRCRAVTDQEIVGGKIVVGLALWPTSHERAVRVSWTDAPDLKALSLDLSSGRFRAGV